MGNEPIHVQSRVNVNIEISQLPVFDTRLEAEPQSQSTTFMCPVSCL